jgi:hypothetical protein
MEGRSVLLEHTLVLAGEAVESGSVWQGWPSASQQSLPAHRLRMKALLDKSLSFRFSASPSEDSDGANTKPSMLRRVYYGSSSTKPENARWESSQLEILDEKTPLLKEKPPARYSDSFV